MPRTNRAPDWIPSFLEALRTTGGVIRPAANIAHVGRSTVYAELKRNPAFKDEVADIQERSIENVEATLYQAALNPAGTTDRIFYLKTRRPEVYADRLNPHQLQQIKADARREVLEEIERELQALAPQARRLVANALVKARPKEIEP